MPQAPLLLFCFHFPHAVPLARCKAVYRAVLLSTPPPPPLSVLFYLFHSHALMMRTFVMEANCNHTAHGTPSECPVCADISSAKADAYTHARMHAPDMSDMAPVPTHAFNPPAAITWWGPGRGAACATAPFAYWFSCARPCLLLVWAAAPSICMHAWWGLSWHGPSALAVLAASAACTHWLQPQAQAGRCACTHALAHTRLHTHMCKWSMHGPSRQVRHVRHECMWLADGVGEATPYICHPLRNVQHPRSTS